MPRRVFFSFHYDRDIWRVNQVRNSHIVRGAYETQPFLDHAAWEAVRRQSQRAVEQWIDRQLEGSSVTCVLIGSETDSRAFVHYEIDQSIKRGNGLLGVRIHQLKNRDGRTDPAGPNPFDRHRPTSLWQQITIPNYPVYDWVTGDGYKNFRTWVESAAQAAGR